MNTTVALYKAEGNISDKIIRLWTRSVYSHCELIVDGKWYSSSPRDGEVRSKLIQPKPVHWDFVEIEASKEKVAKMVSFLNSQIGKKYDWLGIFLSQALPLEIQDPNRWFCSEICSRALMDAGILECDKPAQWFSPERLYEKILEK